MGSMFGGSDDSSSREMIDMQKQEAAEARAKEVQRQARLKSGLSRIKGAFHGTPEMVKKSFDWSTFDPAKTKAGAVPGMAGFSFVDLPATPGTPGTPARYNMPQRDVPVSHHGTGNVKSNQRREVAPAVAGTPGMAAGMYIRGPDGKLYKRGDVVSGNVATGKTLNDPTGFFEKFKQGILDYYTPQVAEKYQDAKDESTYRLARAGTLRSSGANEVAADLYKQNLVNTGEVRSKADIAAADLKSRAAAEEAKAVAQLYATENPDVAANQATAAIRNITAEETPTTALGDIFDVAAIGGAKYLQGRDNAAFAKRVGALPKPGSGTSIVG